MKEVKSILHLCQTVIAMKKGTLSSKNFWLIQRLPACHVTKVGPPETNFLIKIQNYQVKLLLPMKPFNV